MLDLSKLKAFADNKLNVTKMVISVWNRAENIVGKGENAGNLKFSLKFSKGLFHLVAKGLDCKIKS